MKAALIFFLILIAALIIMLIPSLLKVDKDAENQEEIIQWYKSKLALAYKSKRGLKNKRIIKSITIALNHHKKIQYRQKMITLHYDSL